MDTHLIHMPEDKRIQGGILFEDCYDSEVHMEIEGAFKLHPDADVGRALVGKITKILNDHKIAVLVYHLTDDRFEFIGAQRRDAGVPSTIPVSF